MDGRRGIFWISLTLHTNLKETGWSHMSNTQSAFKFQMFFNIKICVAKAENNNRFSSKEFWMDGTILPSGLHIQNILTLVEVLSQTILETFNPYFSTPSSKNWVRRLLAVSCHTKISNKTFEIRWKSSHVKG
jgi:hypothetical protein